MGLPTASCRVPHPACPARPEPRRAVSRVRILPCATRTHPTVVIPSAEAGVPNMRRCCAYWGAGARGICFFVGRFCSAAFQAAAISSPSYVRRRSIRNVVITRSPRRPRDLLFWPRANAVILRSAARLSRASSFFRATKNLSFSVPKYEERFFGKQIPHPLRMTTDRRMRGMVNSLPWGRRGWRGRARPRRNAAAFRGFR